MKNFYRFYDLRKLEFLQEIFKLPNYCVRTCSMLEHTKSVSGSTNKHTETRLLGNHKKKVGHIQTP